MILRSIVIFILLISYSFDKKELVGIWQDTPDVASGWTDTYQFFENGKFTFNYNQMICDKRTISFSGRWEFETGDKLTLTIKEKVILVGGKLVPAMGSCGSDYEIEGGEIKLVLLKDIEKKIVQLSSKDVDLENRGLTRMNINGKIFWRLNEDPSKY